MLTFHDSGIIEIECLLEEMREHGLKMPVAIVLSSDVRDEVVAHFERLYRQLRSNPAFKGWGYDGKLRPAVYVARAGALALPFEVNEALPARTVYLMTDSAHHSPAVLVH